MARSPRRKAPSGAARKGAAREGGRVVGGLFSALRLSPRLSGEARQRTQELKGLAMVFFSAWILLALISFYGPYDDPAAASRNWGGRAGFYVARIALSAAGAAGYLFGVLGASWGFVLVARRQVPWASVRLFSGLAFVVSIAFLVELASGPGTGASARLPYGPGGWPAHQAVPMLTETFGEPGLWVLLVCVGLLSFLLATERAFYPSLHALVDWAQERREVRGESLPVALLAWVRQLLIGLWDFLRGAGLEEAVAVSAAGSGASVARSRAAAPAATAAPSASEEDDDEDEEEWEDDEDADEEWEDEDDADEEEDEEEWEGDEEQDVVVPAPAAKAARGKTPVQTSLVRAAAFDPPTPPKGPWTFPPVDLLAPPDRDVDRNDRGVEDAARKLEHVLQSFRVDASVVGAQVGPTVTLFELEVAQGTRMNKVTQLSQEIAAGLRAKSVRISAPIPGKPTVGIEVPNPRRRRVRISELVTVQAYDKKFAALPLFLGMDTEGTPIVEDLARMPHLLIAGTTGSGKSVCINTVLASLLLTRSPHDVQLILIDPKMVELQTFANIPHLMLPVVTDMRQATNVLEWAVEKMEGRYELFKDAGVRNIKGYNALSEKALRERMGDDFDENRTPRHLPYVVIVIDELADLMMVSKKEAEHAITRLAQKSRAVGIHVILATQRPSTDVITGVIKGNLPTRIAFQVTSKVDSRVILDHMGAEKLLGGGDMLYNPPQTSGLKRVQGALVEDEELQALVDFVCQEAAPTFDQELVQVATGTAQAGAGSEESGPGDEMWDEAVRVILKSRRGSASLLQRALGIGYTRASRLLDQMGEAGIVGAYKGSKAREVLLSLEDWEERTGSRA